jgi:hypothetical protein
MHSTLVLRVLSSSFPFRVESSYFIEMEFGVLFYFQIELL